MTDFSERARKAARRAERQRAKDKKPKRVRVDPAEFKQCWLCPFSTRARCRSSGLGCAE